MDYYCVALPAQRQYPVMSKDVTAFAYIAYNEYRFVIFLVGPLLGRNNSQFVIAVVHDGPDQGVEAQVGANKKVL